MSVRHTPPAAARNVLGPVAGLFAHPDTMALHENYQGASFLCRLPGGALYFESGLQLDTDGSAHAAADPTGQSGTSVTDAANDRPLDADTVNYFVLPGGGFAARHGIRLGDIAAVVRGKRMAFACFGDVGPAKKLGEGSIALHRALGFERVVNGQLQNVGIADGVVTIVFPGSGRPPPDPARPGRRVGVSSFESSSRGMPPFQSLYTAGLKYERQVLDGLRTRQIGIRWGDQAELERRLRPWVDELVAVTPHPPTIDGRKPADHLLATADGLDVLLGTPVPMTLPTARSPSPPKTVAVHARFDLDTDAEGRPFVRHITFYLDPTDKPPPSKRWPPPPKPEAFF